MHHTFPGNCLIFAPLSYTGRRTTYSRAKEIFSGTVPPSSIPKCAIRNDVANEGQFFIICLQPDPALLFLLPGPIRGSHPIRTRSPPFFLSGRKQISNPRLYTHSRPLLFYAFIIHHHSPHFPFACSPDIILHPPCTRRGRQPAPIILPPTIAFVLNILYFIFSPYDIFSSFFPFYLFIVDQPGKLRAGFHIFFGLPPSPLSNLSVQISHRHFFPAFPLHPHIISSFFLPAHSISSCCNNSPLYLQSTVVLAIIIILKSLKGSSIFLCTHFHSYNNRAP